MNHENVAVVTDSGCSMRPDDLRVQELRVTILPLEITFSHNGEHKSISDLSLLPEDFYNWLRSCGKKLPSTSGSILGPATRTYKNLLQEYESVVSIHLTSKHSAVYSSALLAARTVDEKSPHPRISVIDSKMLSLGTWFSVEQAAILAKEGATAKEITEEVSGFIPKIKLIAALDTLENAVKSGRLPFLAGFLGSALQIKPILEMKDGELKEKEKTRRTESARKRLVEIVMEENEKDQGIAKMAVLHTNALEPAKNIQDALSKFYPRKIPLVEAGSIFAIHGGEGITGIVYQKV